MCRNQVTGDILAQFDRTPTPAILVFEVVVIAAAVATVVGLSRKTPRVLQHFLALAVGVLIFQIFTAPMWDNHHLGPWAYVYHDVSWVLTVLWSTMILLVIFLVDRSFDRRPEWQRFCLYLVALTPMSVIVERLLVLLGIRGYAPEILERTVGPIIPLIDVPAAALYYLPVFLTLSIGFYKYWAPVIDQQPVPEARGSHLARRLVLAFVGVFFFEILIEPMVNNQNFPAWSYILYDITFIMTSVWVLLVVGVTSLVDRLAPRRLEPRLRFAAYLVAMTAIATPLEAWFIDQGFRAYGPSATANFSGFRAVLGDIPIEVALAVPLYLALVIGFIRYWERIGNYQPEFTGQPANQVEGRPKLRAEPG